MNESDRLILNLLAEGKITAAEAEKLINAINNGTKTSSEEREEEKTATSQGPKDSEPSSGTPPPGGEKHFSFSRDSQPSTSYDKIWPQIQEKLNEENAVQKLREVKDLLAKGVHVLQDHLESVLSNIEVVNNEAAPGSGEFHHTTVEMKEYDITNAAEVHIENLFGDVALKVGANTSVLKVQKIIKSSDENLDGQSQDNIQVQTETASVGDSSESFSIRVECPPEHTSNVVSLSVQVPANRKIYVKTSSGSVQVQALEEDAGGLYQIESVSGEISLNECQGSLLVKTESGNVKAHQLQTAQTQITTESGNVTAELQDFRGFLAVRSMGGDISLSIKGASSFRYSLSNDTGAVFCSLQTVPQPITSKFVVGCVEDGAGTLNAQSQSGNITLMREETTDTV
jgi:DUF4097 and DUF4098 domain-containing protein YvlB